MNSTVMLARRSVAAAAVLILLGALATIVVLSGGIGAFNFPVKLGIIAIGATLGLGLTYFRPILFPFAAYLYMVPFDSLLQTGSGTITKFLGLACAAVALLVLTDRRYVVKPPVVVGLWGAFLLWNVCSLMWSLDPGFRPDLLVETAELYALFFIFSMLRVRRSDLNILLTAVVAGGTTCAGYGVWLFSHGTSVHSDSALSHRLSIIVSPGSGINADHFSAALVFPVAVAMVAALHFRGWTKAASAVVLVVLLCGIYASATRGSLVAVGVIWVYLMIFDRHRVQLGTLGAVGLLATIPFPSMWQRFFDPSQGDAGGRYGIWGIAWAAFKPHWVLGNGADQFRLAYSQAYLAAAKNAQGMHRWQEDAHNLVVSTSVELGVVGLILISLAWFYQVRVGKNIPRSSPLFTWRIALEAATIGLLIDAMSVDLMFYKYLWITFTLGVLVRNCWLSENRLPAVASSTSLAQMPRAPYEVIRQALPAPARLKARPMAEPARR